MSVIGCKGTAFFSNTQVYPHICETKKYPASIGTLSRVSRGSLAGLSRVVRRSSAGRFHPYNASTNTPNKQQRLLKRNLCCYHNGVNTLIYSPSDFFRAGIRASAAAVAAL